jgi:hypothetical protein
VDVRRTALVGFLSVLGIVAGGILVQADTLILRDGRRIQGELRGVRNGVIEFEESLGWRGTRVVRFDRDEIRRIELNEDDTFDEASSPIGQSDNRDPQTRRNGMREREVVVAADVQWNDTRVDLRAGQVVHFEARGRVSWGPGRRDGPAGESRSPSNPGRPMPNRPAAALIGKIGDESTDYFFIGDNTGPMRMGDGGRLYLGINDDYLIDNSSNFRVTVYY